MTTVNINSISKDDLPWIIEYDSEKCMLCGHCVAACSFGAIKVDVQKRKKVRAISNEEGFQIDLIISRNDNVVNMCEIKYYSDDYSVDNKYYRTILRRQEILSNCISRKQSINSTLITTFGLKKNEYSGVFTNVVTLDDLFEK